MKKRLFIGLLVGAAVFASAYGVAASLGTLTADNLGAAGQDVETCATAASADWNPVYNSAFGFETGDVDVTLTMVNDDDCEGSEVTVLLSDENDVEVASLTETWGAAAEQTIDFGTEDVPAEDVYGIDVLVDGAGLLTTP